jgi:membrane associated rhomboid family serine protease
MIPLKDNLGLARIPIVTIALILASVVAYLVATLHGGWLLITGPRELTVVNYGAIPYEFRHWGQHCGISFPNQAVACTGQPLVAGTAGPQPATWVTAFTAMFLNANILELAVNMTFLAAFGPTVENRVGSLKFLCFYVLGGLVALALQTAVGPGSTVPLLGSSGAVAALLGAYVAMYPRARIVAVALVLFRVTLIELSAGLVIAVWIALDAILGALGLSTALGGSAGVSYYAHLGAFAFGLPVGLTIGRSRRHSANA